jgi:geranylgeranyl reductase family protein
MTTTSVDVAIVGAGPAGAAAAITVARAGQRVVLIDKATFPRDKICGDGITTGALRLLEDLGLRPEQVPSWTEVGDIHVVSPSGHQATFPLPRNRGQFAAVMRRTDLDHALVEVAVAAGAALHQGAEVKVADDHGEVVTLGLSDGTTISAAHVVAADGMWSPMRKLLGTAVPGYLGEWHAFRQYFDHVGPLARDLWVWFEPDLLPGYAWCFPLPGGGANVGFGIQRGAKVATKEMKALWPQLLARPHIARVLGPNAVAEDRHQAWPIPARVGEVALTAGRVLWAGDAAAVTDPMTGEGIGQALLTGQLAGEAILAGGGPSEIRSRYEQEVIAALRADHQMSLLLIRALAHRKGARAAVRLADLNDWTRRNFARWLFEDEPRAIAVTPRRWHREFLARDGAYLQR